MHRTVLTCVATVAVACSATQSDRAVPPEPAAVSEPSEPELGTAPEADPEPVARAEAPTPQPKDPEPAAPPPAAEAPPPEPPTAPAATEPKAEAAAAPPTITGANINAGEISADGFTAANLSCRLDGGGLFATLAIIGALSKRKRALDKCAPGGDATVATFSFKGGRVTESKANGATSAKRDSCVAKAIRKAAIPMAGQCRAVLLLGKEKAARAAMPATLERFTP